MDIDYLPDYQGGRASGFVPDGCGLSDDILSAVNTDDCYINVIENTDTDAFLSYCAALESEGFKVTFRRDEEGGVYREMLKGERLLYLYYIPCEKTARIISDNASLPLSVFAAENGESPAGEEILTQFGLYYSEMVRGVTCDCGMLYAVKLSNGEFIVIDGGEVEQATEAACAEFISRLQAQTGKEDIVIALWFCTHPHNDHMDFFSKLLREYGDIITLKRAMFNFPSFQYHNTHACVTLMKERIKNHTPGVKFLKPHAGQRFSLSGTVIDVLSTQEDVLRPFEERKYHGTNETSAVIKITSPGFSFVVLGDIPEENGDILVNRFKPDELSCTFLQAAHHCINKIENVYKNVPARYILIPERTGMILTHMLENYETIKKYHPEESIFCAGDGTATFRMRGGDPDVEIYPVVGGAYDGSAL